MNTFPTSRTLLLAALAISTPLLLVGCTDAETPSGDGGSHAQGDDHDGHAHSEETADTQASPDLYEGILGELTEVPIADDPSTGLKIHHQQIIDFKNEAGEVHVNSKGIAGMPAMTMPYPVGEGVSIEGLAIGDKIRFSFRVNWGGSTGPAWEITTIEKIDPATEIDFTNKIEEAIDDAMDTMKDQMDDHSGHEMGSEGP
jgi:Cu/Ag efflux protein CusF